MTPITIETEENRILAVKDLGIGIYALSDVSEKLKAGRAGLRWMEECETLRAELNVAERIIESVRTRMVSAKHRIIESQSLDDRRQHETEV